MYAEPAITGIAADSIPTTTARFLRPLQCRLRALNFISPSFFLSQSRNSMARWAQSQGGIPRRVCRDLPPSAFPRAADYNPSKRFLEPRETTMGCPNKEFLQIT